MQAKGHSAVLNGSELLHDVDHRTAYMRRYAIHFASSVRKSAAPTLIAPRTRAVNIKPQQRLVEQSSLTAIVGVFAGRYPLDPNWSPMCFGAP
jgi:hypothetical protein